MTSSSFEEQVDVPIVCESTCLHQDILSFHQFSVEGCTDASIVFYMIIEKQISQDIQVDYLPFLSLSKACQ